MKLPDPVLTFKLLDDANLSHDDSSCTMWRYEIQKYEIYIKMVIF